MPKPRDVYGNEYVPPEYTGYEDDEFDGETLIDNLLNGDTE